jgi:peptidoglycan hydrolase CwlO-like protein
MRKTSILIILCAILILLNYAVLDIQAKQDEKLRELQAERAAMAAQVALLDRQVRDLMDQHEKLVWISQDIDQRIIAIQEGRKPWEDVSGRWSR